VRFVGRQAELDALADVAATATKGPAVAVVVGDPGSGKTRLLEEARSRSSVPHSFSVVGYEAGQTVPLAAASGLLRALADAPVDGARLEELAFGGDQSGSLEPVRLFEAAHRALARFEPALLVIDDLQWVDELSYALSHYLLRAAIDSRQRLLVYAARRGGGRGSELGDVVGASVQVIELGPLNRDDGIDLACAVNADLDRDAAAELWEHAEGSPFWIGALALEQATGRGAGELITARLRGAGPDPAELLALLAVVGRSLEVGEAATLLEWPPERVASALEQLVDRGLAIARGPLARTAHDLVREAAIDEAPAEMRRRFHSLLAEHLELRAQEDVARLREALEHRRAAGLPTVALATRLARSPRRRLIGATGVDLLAEIADEAEPFDTRALELRESLAELAAELGENERALEQWSIVAERTDARRRRAEALLAAGKAAYVLELRSEARALLDRSRDLGSADDVLELEQRTLAAAIRLWLERDTEQGRAAADVVVRGAERLARSRGGTDRLDPRARLAYLDALRLESDAALQVADTPRLLRAGEAREQAALGFDLEQFLAASLNVGAALRWAGHVPEALERFRRVWDEAQRHVLPRLAVDASYWLGSLLHLCGAVVEGERVVQQAMELVGRVGDVPRGRHRVLRVARGIELERGRANALDRLALDVTAETNDHQRIDLHGDLALWRARLDGSDALDEVRDQVEAGMACAESVGCPRCEAELILLAGEALARAGDRAQARRLLERWRPAGGSQVFNEIALRHGRALAESTADTRASALEGALELANTSPYALLSLWTGLDLGLVLAEVGDARAVPMLQQTAGAARDRGAGTAEGLAEEALRSLGVRTWRRGARGAPLTDREREVSELAAGGATNREIARTLFLSPKTVERHVSNALRKLGARNRTELAARLREQSGRTAGNAR
jgi:DNA-binding CsgD family transcriptional regulator